MNMDARERMMAAAYGKPVDVVPVAPYAGNYGGVLAGVPVGLLSRDSGKLAEAQWRTYEILGHDAVVVQSDGYYIAEGFGLLTDAHRDEIPSVRKWLLNEPSDALALKRIPDPEMDGRMPVYLEAIRRLHDLAQGKVAVRACGTGPFSLAGHLMGPQSLVTALAVLSVEPDTQVEGALRYLMELTTRATTDFALAALAAGADIVQAGDSLASLSFISPAVYQEWVWPYECRFFETVAPAAEEQGAAALLHICGNTTAILKSMAATGAHILEIDAAVDLAAAREIAGPSICLMGNLDPSSVLLQGSADVVEEHALRAIESAGQPFILGSGCEVAPATPVENMHRLVLTGHQLRL